MSGLREALYEVLWDLAHRSEIHDGMTSHEVSESVDAALALLPEHRDEVRALIGDEPTAKHRAVITHPREEP